MFNVKLDHVVKYGEDPIVGFHPRRIIGDKFFGNSRPSAKSKAASDDVRCYDWSDGLCEALHSFNRLDAGETNALREAFISATCLNTHNSALQPHFPIPWLCEPVPLAIDAAEGSELPSSILRAEIATVSFVQEVDNKGFHVPW